MPYDFPPRYLRPREVLNPDDLTQELSYATSRLSGGLDSHNLQEQFASTTEMRHRLGFRSAIGVRHKWYAGDISTGRTGDRSPTYFPSGWPDVTNAYTTTEGSQVERWLCSGSEYALWALPNTASWYTLRDVELSSSQPTRIWVTAFAQYVWNGELIRSKDLADKGERSKFPAHCWQYGAWDQTDPTAFAGGIDAFPIRIYPARVQLAVRVNGRLIDETVTGSQNPEQKAVQPLKMTVERLGTDDQFPGPSMKSTPQRSALGPIAWPSRIGCVVDIPPGDNVVELVYRRLDDHRYQKKFGSRDNNNRVFTTACSMTVVDMPWGPGAPTQIDSVTTPVYANQTLLSRDSVYSSRLRKIENNLNRLEAGSLSPGALRLPHLETGLTFVNYKSDSWCANRSDGYGSGFTMTNRRPNSHYSKSFRDGSGGTSFSDNPDRPLISHWVNDTRGWALWGVRNRGYAFLKDIGCFGTTYDTADSEWEVADTGNSSTPYLVEEGDTPFDTGSPKGEEKAFAVLHGDWVFQRGRRRQLLVFADAGVMAIVGDRTHSTGDNRERASTNATVYACFRIGFHVKGNDANDWVLPSRSEALLNQTGCFRVHQKSNHYRMPTHGIASTYLAVRRPWHDQAGNYWYDESHPWYVDWADEPTYTAGTDDFVIDAIGLFVSGTEHHNDYAPSIGLRNATLSAVLIDEGPD